MLQGIGSHGTIISFQPLGSGVFTDIAELGDLSGTPGLSRNEFDITSHNRDIDTYIMGVLRRDPISFPMFFNKAIASQELLRTAMLNGNQATNMSNGFKFTTPDGDVFVFSGGVKEMKFTAPVDGVRTANVVLRATGAMIVNDVTYGS